MQALQVNFIEADQSIKKMADATPSSWEAVCERFDNDVHRVKIVTDPDGYTALYACYDENNQPVYYLVEENQDLSRLRHKTFLDKLGRPKA